MLPRERVAAAFAHKPADKVPIYQAGLSGHAGRIVLGREAFVGGGIQRYRECVALYNGDDAHAEFLHRSFEDACEICLKLELDMVRTIYWRMPRQPTKLIDEYTMVFGDPDSDDNWEVWQFDPPSETFMCADKPPQPIPTIDDLRRHAEANKANAEQAAPTPDSFPDHQQALDRFGATHGIPGTGVGCSIPRDTWWLEATVLAPDVVATYLDYFAIMGPKNARVMAQMGLPYCFGGGDFCGKGGPLYSPRVFHELMLPRLQIISEGCKAAGVHHLFATDGNVWPVAEDLMGASGITGFYELDRQYMPMRDVHAKFPHLTLLGGIRSEVLHTGTVEDCIEEARTALQDAKEMNCCVIGCSNQIVAGTPPENFWAMMETLHAERDIS